MDSQARGNERLRTLLKETLDRNRGSTDDRRNSRTEVCTSAAVALLTELNDDVAKAILYIQCELNWPLAWKVSLLHCVNDVASDSSSALNGVAKLVLNPRQTLKQGIFRRTHDSRSFIPTIASVERQYGSGVSSIFRLQHAFFLLNVFTLIVWLAFVTIPYQTLTTSQRLPNASFALSTLFTTKGFLAQSNLFQGSYPAGLVNDKYDLSLFYLVSSYLYFLIWFIFLTQRFASAYKQRIFHSVLASTRALSFVSTFARYNYATRASTDKAKSEGMFQRIYLDLMLDDRRTADGTSKPTKTVKLRLKMIITNLFYVVLALVLSAVNWIVLSSCAKPNIDCYGSIIYLVLINRLVPYIITLLTQVENYEQESYKLDVVAFRCVFLHACTILSFTIHFFIGSHSCYETAYGQYIYILLLGDLFLSLVLPFLFGFLCDLLPKRGKLSLDGINIQLQLSAPMLLYSQFLIWLGVYFAPLLPVLVIFNVLFSFISHRLYLFIRSRRSDPYKNVLAFDAYQLECNTYLFAYILLIISVTSFLVFTTQVKPSHDCGPFRYLNSSYEVISDIYYGDQRSVYLVSIINFVTSPGFIYFLGIIFFVLTYKLRNEGLAEKQLVFIRENSLERKKHLRQNEVKKFHQADGGQAARRPEPDRAVNVGYGSMIDRTVH